MSRRKPTRAKQLGVTDEQYDATLKAQGGGCAICGNPPKTRRLDTDHDHRTGDVRGLLCHRCNRALPTWVTVGWLVAAIEYLEQHAGRPSQGELEALRELLDETRGNGVTSPLVQAVDR